MIQTQIQKPSVTAAEETMAAAIITTLDSIAEMLSPMVEQSCVTICREFSLISKMLNGDEADASQLAQARAHCHRIMMTMQFQDRHKQALQDMQTLLRQLRMPDEILSINALCERLQLQEIRDLLRWAAGQWIVGEAVLPSEPIEIF